MDDDTQELIDELQIWKGGERAVIAYLIGYIDAIERDMNLIHDAVRAHRKQTLVSALKESRWMRGQREARQ